MGPVRSAICLVLTVYWFVLLARILLSWFPAPRSDAARSIVSLIWEVTDPVLRPLRRMIPPVRLGAVALDLSPIIVFIVIAAVQGAICRP